MNSISFGGRDAAEAWLRDAEDLNNEANNYMTQVAATLKEVAFDSEGTIVDELVAFGEQVTTFTANLVKGIGQISTTIHSIVSKFSEAFDAISGVIGNVASVLK